MAARPRQSWSTCPAKARPSSPASTATRWRGRAAPDRRWRSRRSARSSPAPSPRIVIAALVTPLTALAVTFTAAEYFSLMVLGLVAAVVMARGSVAKALAMIVIGLLLGLVGTDVHTGLQRFTFGAPDLFDGIDFVVDRRRRLRLRQHHRQPGEGRGRADRLRPQGEDPATVADARGFPPGLAGVGARHAARLRPRRAARRRRGASRVCRLFARTQAGEGPHPLRQGRGGRRRRT